MQKIIVIAGPTASGKSGLALACASIFKGIIINADSQQLFKGLPILTAQPSLAEKRKIPHFLYEAFPLNIPVLSASAWCEYVDPLVQEHNQEGKKIYLVGGSGFYLKTLIDGISPMPEISFEKKQSFREAYEKIETSILYAQLLKIDFEKAQKIASRDRQRILHGLLIYEETYRPLSYWQKLPRKKSPFSFFKILVTPSRDLLKKRIDQSFVEMIEQGVVEEVARFFEHPHASFSPLCKALGLMELKAYLDGKNSLENAIQNAVTRTHQYAKRQMTWFRHQFPPDYVVSDIENLPKQAEQILEAYTRYL